jgi:hypothetical protein
MDDVERKLLFAIASHRRGDFFLGHPLWGDDVG